MTETRTCTPCYACGGEVTGFSYEAITREITSEPEPLWDGGPLVDVPLMTPRLEVVGSIYRVEPCGHEVPRESIVVTVRQGQDAS